MPRPQFTLRALLVAMLVVGAFFAGAAWQRERDKPVPHALPAMSPYESIQLEYIELPDGSRWTRPTQ